MSRFCLLSLLVLSLLAVTAAQFSVTTIRAIVQCTECSGCKDLLVPIYPDYSKYGMLISDIAPLAAAACAGPYKFQSISTGAQGFVFNNSDPAALVLQDSAIIYDTTLESDAQQMISDEEQWKLQQRPEERMPASTKRMFPQRHSRPSQWSAPPPSHHLSFAPDNSCVFSRYVPCAVVLQLDCLFSGSSPVQLVPVQLTPSMLVSEVVSLLSLRCGAQWTNITIVIDALTVYNVDSNRLAADVFRTDDYVIQQQII